MISDILKIFTLEKHKKLTAGLFVIGILFWIWVIFHLSPLDLIYNFTAYFGWEKIAEIINRVIMFIKENTTYVAAAAAMVFLLYINKVQMRKIKGKKSHPLATIAPAISILLLTFITPSSIERDLSITFTPTANIFVAVIALALLFIVLASIFVVLVLLWEPIWERRKGKVIAKYKKMSWTKYLAIMTRTALLEMLLSVLFIIIYPVGLILSWLERYIENEDMTKLVEKLEGKK